MASDAGAGASKLVVTAKGEFVMKKKTFGLITALGLALGAGGALGQTTWKVTCTNTGPGAPETLGEGHTILVGSSVCMTEGSVLDRAVVTQSVIWENIKGTATLLSGDGVARKPGALAAYRNTGGTLKVLMEDGKSVGWEASGTGVYTTATGTAASVKGKSFSWAGRSTGPRTYVIENRMD